MKPSSKSRIREALVQIDQIILACKKAEHEYQEELQKVRPKYHASALNLVHYIAYRNQATSNLKRFLFNKGLSGLKNAEAHILASLLVTRRLLYQLLNETAPTLSKPNVSIKKSLRLAKSNSRELFGNKSKKRNVRIMVTQPTEAANNGRLALEMMLAGMNTIRINCAHDSTSEWLKMIEQAHIAMKKTGKHVKITMDLGGPKIRTGAIEQGPKVAHLRPDRDGLGRVINPGRAGFLPEGELFPDEDNVYIPIPLDILNKLDKEDEIHFTDTRGKHRMLKVMEKEAKVVWVHGYDSIYIQTGTKMKSSKLGEEFLIGEIPPLEQYLLLKKGDHLIVHKDQSPGQPAQYDEDGNLLQRAHISCTSQEVFNFVKTGEKVVFDDGKIIGDILENTGNELLIKINHTKDLGSKLKVDKGINFPTSSLLISGLTSKDKEDLKFVTQHADVINMSFVNQPEDIVELMDELNHLNASDMGVILKIETMMAVRNIVKILLTAMQMEKIGVMIARGDLAIECGWQNVGVVQEELLKICRAAHIPTVWATQVMENLAKKGVPSRAEITDAVMAQKADCVMLNKGMYILEAIQLLHTILVNIDKVRFDKKKFFKEMEY